MKEIGKTIKLMEKEHMSGILEIDTKEIGLNF